MKVNDILHVKDNTLHIVAPETKLQMVMQTVVKKGIGSLVIIEYGELVGMLTSQEIIKVVAKNHSSAGDGTTVRKVMGDHPTTRMLETEVSEVRHIMLEHHVCCLPVLDSRTLMDVTSFYNIAKVVFEDQSLENKILKAYIRGWPEEKANED